MSEELQQNNQKPETFFNTRLDRIEEKIDKLSDAMVSIARAEERIVAIEQDRKDYVERMNSHSMKIDELDRKVNVVDNTINILDKVSTQDRNANNTRLNIVEKKLEEMTKLTEDASRTVSIINRLFWITATGTLAYIGSQIFTINIA